MNNYYCLKYLIDIEKLINCAFSIMPEITELNKTAEPLGITF